MNCYLLTLLLIQYQVFCVPVSDQNSLVLSSEEKKSSAEDHKNDATTNIDIYSMHVVTKVANRYAKTSIASKVKNEAENSQEAIFSVILPERAFISGFIMHIDGKDYKAYVKDKVEAKKIYDEAVSQGQSAAHVSTSARDSNRFTVSINLEAAAKAKFLLTYEELLERQNEMYEIVINIHPGQLVESLTTNVYINESLPLKFVRTPNLRTGNEIGKEDDKLQPTTKVEILNGTSAVVKFSPTYEQQKDFAKNLGTKENDGLAGQFVVQYDVERPAPGGEVLLQDGYFVHFFSPDDLAPLPKHVIFTLDTSGSMSGQKISQLKDAMKNIITQLQSDDLISLIEFNNYVILWDIDTIKSTESGSSSVSQMEHPPASLASNPQTIENAKEIIDKLNADGGTFLIGGLEAALISAGNAKKMHNGKCQPIIIMLTDGEPSVGISSTEEIITYITNMNQDGPKVPIFTLSFGDGADKKFLRKLSLQNQAFSRHIYDAADSALQLKEYYKKISAILLSDIHFKYVDEPKNAITEVPRMNFPMAFLGSELVVTGKYNEGLNEDETSFEVEGTSLNGVKSRFKAQIKRPVLPLERAWVYLTIRDLLDKRELAKSNATEINKKALDLALKYSFITDVSSLVVVKPNAITAVHTENMIVAERQELLLPMPRTTTKSLPSTPKITTELTSTPKITTELPPTPKITTELPLTLKITTELPSTPEMTTLLPPIQIDLKSSYNPKEVKKLLVNLPWMKHIYVYLMNSVHIRNSIYTLGDNSTMIQNYQSCSNAPQNANGTCSLLINCPQVNPSLTSATEYEKYFCALDIVYAGVCCPTTSS